MGREVRHVAPDWVHPTDECGDLVPLSRDEMPVWAEGQATHHQMYENTSEGTPISPVIESPEHLAQWLVDNQASAFGDQTASYEGWLRVCHGHDSISGVLAQGQLINGVDYAAQTEDRLERLRTGREDADRSAEPEADNGHE